MSWPPFDTTGRRCVDLGDGVMLWEPEDPEIREAIARRVTRVLVGAPDPVVEALTKGEAA